MRKVGLFIGIISMVCLKVYTQNGDTTPVKHLGEIHIQSTKTIGDIERLPIVKDHVIYAGKKTEVMVMDKINADLSINNTRQVFAKVPGISIWENDGSGIQVGVASRGLSPNRSWEFNVRQNGYDIASEVFGYPETYFTPPMEALHSIEVVRGAASLQYGPQFGGLLQYQIKKGNAQKPIALETHQTIGSYGLFNSFNAIGGTYKKLNYYSYIHYRNAEGWRDNSKYKTTTGYIGLHYAWTKKLTISGEYTRMGYSSQQPGGLTDVAFQSNAQQSFRTRNWFGAPFQVASLQLKYSISTKVSAGIISFITDAERNSVGWLQPISVKDSIYPKTGLYQNRQVDRDAYLNMGAEFRLTAQYKMLGELSVLATGVRAYKGRTKRNQLGKGNAGTDFDLTLIDTLFGRSLSFETINYSVFAENVFQLGKALKLVPGVRFEYIENSKQGYINISKTGALPLEKNIRRKVLWGMGGEYSISEKTTVYSNYTLAYRPVTFSELTPSATTETIDPNLVDASGFNFDLGYRGVFKKVLSFDIGIFYMHYANRIGSYIRNGSLFKTNIGSSESKGVESYLEWNLTKTFMDQPKIGTLVLFASNAFIDAKYIEWKDPNVANDPLKTIQDKKVENAPTFIHRFGVNYHHKGFSLAYQVNTVGSVYTDAFNTEVPNASGTVGKLAGYTVMDVSLCYKFMRYYQVKAGINNVADEVYATRRAGGYPGPGLLPGNGRTMFVGLGASF